MLRLLATCAAIAVSAASAADPVKLIIDTDFGGGGCQDVDDVVAVAIGNALADNGEAELLAVVQNTAPVRCAGAISVVNHYYGRDDVPIGAYDVNTEGATLEMENPHPYVDALVDDFDSPIDDSSQAEDAVDLYRRVLAAQPDRSVAISSVGLLTNLAALLRSGPDENSPLDGRALVAQKVYLLAVMAGTYPYDDFPECNMSGGCCNQHNSQVSAEASYYVSENWPAESKILWSGFEVGVDVITGGPEFQQCDVATFDNPVLVAMVEYFGGPNIGRCSWDPLTTLIAVRGAAAGGCAECSDCDGKNSVNPNSGSNEWLFGEQSNQTYLVLQDIQMAEDAINNLLCQFPVFGPTPAPPLEGGVITNREDGNCLHVDGDGDFPNDYTNVITSGCNDSSNQKWAFNDSGQLIHTPSGKCLDMDANNNNLVEVYSCFGAEWQNWDRVGDTIVNAANGECLDIEGSNAVVRGCDGSDSQNWDMALP